MVPRIVQQIAQRLHQAIFVAHHQQRSAGSSAGDRYAISTSSCRACRRAISTASAINGSSATGLRGMGTAPGLQPREFEDIGDQSLQSFRFLHDDLQETLPGVRVVLQYAIGQRIGAPGNGGERSAQFMRDIRQQIAAQLLMALQGIRHLVERDGELAHFIATMESHPLMHFPRGELLRDARGRAQIGGKPTGQHC